MNLNSARLNVMISNMDKSMVFYVDVLGLKLLNRYGDHYAELDANGFMIALHQEPQDIKRGDNMSIGLGVFNFDKNIELLEGKGITFKHETGGYIRLAHFHDPDGNLLFLAENKK